MVEVVRDLPSVRHIKTYWDTGYLAWTSIFRHSDDVTVTLLTTKEPDKVGLEWLHNIAQFSAQFELDSNPDHYSRIH